MKTIFAQSPLFSVAMSVALVDGLPITHSNIVQIPDVPQPGYLESYVDPVLGAKVTRINNAKGDQTQVYDLDGNKIGPLWDEYGRPSHYDLTMDDVL